MANPLLAINAATAVPTSDVMLNTGVVATGDRISDKPLNRTYQATVRGTGAVSATVLIEVTNETPNGLESWVLLGTMNLAGTDVASAGFPSQTAWRHTRAKCTAISANSNLKVNMGSGSNV